MSHVLAVSRSFKATILVSFAFLIGACTHSLAAGFTISPNTISNSYSGNITFVITGIPAGATIRLEQFVDLDNNGVVDPTDLLVTSFQVTDGQVTAFGGVTDTNIPGDQDAVAGQITTSFSFPNSAEASRVTGPHLFRLSSPSGAFSSVVHPFTVTSTPYSQSVTGKVTNAGATVSNVFVGLLVLSGANNADFFAGTLTDSAGTYSLPAPAGIYFMFTFKAGLVGGFGSPQISINTNQTLSQDITMIPGTETVSGSVTDSVTGLSIPGVELLLQSTTTNTGTLTFSDANGNYSVAVTPDTYKVNLSEKGLGMLGYVRPATKPRITVTTNNVGGVGLGLTKETALIYGNLKTAANQPLAGVSISGNDSSNIYSSSTTTDANGDYILSVVGANTWYFGPDSSSPVLAGYTVQGTNVTLAVNQAVNVNFIAQHVSAHLIGHVIDNTGIPQAGITLFASTTNSASAAQVTTAADGSFDLGVFGGTWDVSVTFNGASYNWMAPSLVFNVTDGVDITNIAFVVLNSTAAITGWVHDPQGAPVPGVNVSASGTVNGTNYFNQVNSDTTGNFQLPVANGPWQVGLGNCLNYGCPTNNFQTVVVNGANVVVDFSFVGPAQLSLNFRHFIYGGDFGGGLTPVTPFPISISQYLAMLTAQNGTAYPPANAVFFTGPAGSGLTGTPATDAVSGNNNSMIYFSPGVTNPPTAPGGTWTIGYNGSITNLNIADPQTSARLFAIIPTAVVSGGQLTSISWVYKDTNGVPLAGAPQFVTQVVVQVFDQNLNGLIASPASAPTTTSYSVSPSLPWSGVGRVRMIYFDNLGNRYFLNFPRSVPSVSGAGALANGQFGFQVTGLIFQNYTVQYSTTLSSWSTLYVTNAPASVFSVLDPNATGPYRFYRILLGP